MGDFEMTNKNLTMEDLTVIFEMMLKEHEESRNQKLFKRIKKYFTSRGSLS